MRKLTYILAVALLWCSGVSATNYWVDGLSGDNGNDGLSSGAPKRDADAIGDTYALTTGDTVVVKNQINDFDINATDSSFVLMDWTLYQNVGSYDINNTDSTIMFGSEWSSDPVTNTCIVFESNNINGVKIVGISFTVDEVNAIQVSNTTGDTLYIENCRFIESSSSTVSLIQVTEEASNSVVNLRQSLFIALSTDTWSGIRSSDPLAEDNTVKFIIEKCTFKGEFLAGCIYARDIDGSFSVHNSILENDYASAGDCPDMGSQAVRWTYDSDYCSYLSGGTLIATWEVTIPIANYSVWQDSCNCDGNTVVQDALLQYTTTTCVPATGSPVLNAGSDSENIGWYQSGSGHKNIVIIH